MLISTLRYIKNSPNKIEYKYKDMDRYSHPIL